VSLRRLIGLPALVALSLLSLLGAGACRISGAPAIGATLPDTAFLGRDIRFLASDQLEGRRSGTPGNDSAATWLARRLAALGLDPVPVGTPCNGNGARCATAHLLPFVARPAAAAHGSVPTELPTQNVAGIIRGRDPALRGQYVVLGAHFDHLGRSTFGAMDPDAADAIRNGADDNASGTAAVLELARLLVRQPPRRSVLVVLFSGEELGLLGSQHFVEHLPVPRDSVQAMLNFDMVGRLRNDRLIVYGVATAAEMPDIVNAANVEPPFRLSPVGDGFGPSDHSSFYAKDLPVLHFFTDLHEDYHRAGDDADKVNLPGTARVVAFAERVARSLADREARLTFTRAPSTASAGSSSQRTASQAWLGSIPDMGANDAPGLRLTGVRQGSPADSAGLRAGDVIVEISGTAVKDLYSYTDALYAHQPGETVTIGFLRGTERHTVRLVLGRRPG
jgi:hypothetical protein